MIAKTVGIIVIKEAVQYVIVETTLKTIAPKRAQRRSKTMFTNADFARLAAKKNATAVVATIVDKTKSVADAAKEAVAAVLPVTHKGLDKALEEHADKIIRVLGEPIAALEQRVEGIELVSNTRVHVQPEKTEERVMGLMEYMRSLGLQTNGKPLAAEPVQEPVAEPVVQQQEPQKPILAKTTRLRLNQ